MTGRKGILAVLVLGWFALLVGMAQAEPIVLKMQSTNPKGDIYHETFVDLAKKIEEMSGGRLKIEVHPGGAVVPPFRVLEAVHEGTLDGGHDVATYWVQKSPAFALYGSSPSFGMDANDLLAWVYYGGGLELYQELLKEHKLNVVSFFYGPQPTQPLGWFKNPITKPEDLKGLRYRTVGLSAELFKELGATVITTPGGEITENIEKGFLDAAEFNNPSSDRALKLSKVRKVYMVQSYHQPVEFFEIMFNKKKWDSIPKDLQAIIKYAAMAESANMSWKWLAQNSKDLNEMVAQEGVKVVRTPRSVLDAQLRAWDKIITAKSRENPMFAKIVNSQKAWAGKVVPLRQMIQVDNEPAFEHYFRKR